MPGACFFTQQPAPSCDSPPPEAQFQQGHWASGGTSLQVRMSPNICNSATGERCKWKLQISHQFINQPNVKNGPRPLFCSQIKLLDNMSTLF